MNFINNENLLYGLMFRNNFNNENSIFNLMLYNMYNNENRILEFITFHDNIDNGIFDLVFHDYIYHMLEDDVKKIRKRILHRFPEYLNSFDNFVSSETVRSLIKINDDKSITFPIFLDIINEKKIEQEEQCSICLENFKENSKKFPCSHEFHSECIDQWIKRRPQCPICRNSLYECITLPLHLFVYNVLTKG